MSTIETKRDSRGFFGSTTVTAVTILLIRSILFSRVTVNVLVFVLLARCVFHVIVYIVTRYMYEYARRRDFALSASFVLRATGLKCRSQVRSQGYRPQTTGQVTGQVTGHRLQVTGHRSGHRSHKK